MFANSQRSPPCGTPSYPPGGSYAAEPEGPSTINLAQYEANSLTLTICDLVASSFCSRSGITAELLKAANRGRALDGATTEQVDHDIADLEDLFEFHQIQHFVLEDGSEDTVRHVFLLRE